MTAGQGEPTRESHVSKQCHALEGVVSKIETQIICLEERLAKVLRVQNPPLLKDGVEKAEVPNLVPLAEGLRVTCQVLIRLEAKLGMILNCLEV